LDDESSSNLGLGAILDPMVASNLLSELPLELQSTRNAQNSGRLQGSETELWQIEDQVGLR